MNIQNVSSLLGLAQKAGKIASGELAVEKAVKSGKAKLIVIAADSSDGTKKRYHDMSQYYQVPLYEVFTKQQLGGCIGKEYRAALAIVDAGLSQAVLKALQ
ncbi:ribosomal L7Ae/L30e/S12e/Gadd45 family protein|uniref:Ribosomal protein L7Ae n=1 Tax=Dendrosporobacter quercicolus TaxID=146817 RepID=A0A1G9LK56_9FIRM|nr:ribosomal L7Ae/L30e/S12e/Gadd45 family protein [Dendrosporobacter quercicolus]NSL46737.1 ribosomal L7Ae/L30e/S12e/Gadd45 family protein [Dendrosporobacter quercicolus DSM 1736]SDL62228.1 Ribosomal protein L7Ae [Dendrosporobacter quercicolus]